VLFVALYLMKYIIILILVFFSCTFKAKNVLMVPRIEEPGIIKLYIDREGHLYPPEAHVTPHYFYLLHQKGAKKNQNNPEFATVQYAIRKNDSLTRSFIHQRYGMPGTDTSGRFFQNLQSTLRKISLEKINSSLKVSGNKELVVLIHGFNDPEPDSYYFSLRRSINAYLGKTPTYIEVFWDGLNALGSNPAVAGIWQKARLNSAKVGLGLRNILKGLPTNVNLTVITHSLGASVATHFLFNPQVWPKKFQESLELEYMSSSIPTPACSSINVGMLAPAISGTTIFDDVLNTIPEKNKSTIKKLVIGYNHFDYAVTKGGLFPRWFGNTALGADNRAEVKKTFQVLQSKIPSIQCTGIDFSYSTNFSLIDSLSRKEKKKLRQGEHAILFYQRNSHFPAFLSALF
jgi:hypothetical protein